MSPPARLARLEAAGESRPVAGLRWLVPCVPSKIVGVGRNYRDHAAELGHLVPAAPLLFLKPPSSILPHGGLIRLPEESRRVDFEGELAAVIGRTARAVPEERALDHVGIHLPQRCHRRGPAGVGRAVHPRQGV